MENSRSLSIKHSKNYPTDAIKSIALLAMITAHTGYVLFPWIQWTKHMGSIAFPLFAYQLSVGFHNTSNIYRYITRLFCVALLAQFPYYYSISGNLNILFTLCLALIAFTLAKKKPKWIQITLFTGTAFIADIGNFDGGLWAILLLSLIHLSYPNLKTVALVVSLYALAQTILLQRVAPLLQIITPLILFLFRKSTFKTNTWIFYILYPGHILLLLIIDRTISFFTSN